MLDHWTLAAVQMDCTLADTAGNLRRILDRVVAAADRGANLIVLPECVLTGYGLPDRPSAVAVAQSVPGPATDAVAEVCRRRNVWVVFGLLEAAGDGLFNTAAIVGPTGFVAGYRKVHLPCVGVDRFTYPGDRPFAVHDLGGCRLGVGICFDLGFPETCRVLTLLGADVIVLPTNWADKALKNATLVSRVRAFENHVFLAAVNRVGVEAGYHYIGRSSIVDCAGDFLAFADHDGEDILTAEVVPALARQKRIVHCVGEYEIDRVNWRRPAHYTRLTEGG